MAGLLLRLLALYLGGVPACAQTVGATYLLTRGPGAEAAALGNTVISTIHDPTALYWNPAGLVNAGGMLTGEHLFLYDGARYDFVGLSVPSALGTFGLGALQLNRDNIVARNAIDDPGSSVSNTQSDYMAGFARMIGEHFAAGGTANILHFNLAGNQDTGVGLDLGGQAFLPTGDVMGLKQPFWSLGAVLKNVMPPSLKLIQDKETFPSELRGGLSLSFKTFSRASMGSGVINNDRATILLSFRRVSGDPALYPALGVSYSWENVVTFRAGYDDGLAAGVGLRTGDGRFSLDYSMENRPLSFNHRFTISYKFLDAQGPALAPAPQEVDDDYEKALARAQSLSQEQYLRGQALFKGLKYAQAIDPLRLAVLLDPGDKAKAAFYQRDLEAARRQKLRDLAGEKDAGMAPGSEAEAYRAIARLLDLRAADRSELVDVQRRVMARMQPADLASAAQALLDKRRHEIQALNSQGLVSDALALAANLEVSESSATADAVSRLKAQVADDGRALRASLEADATDAERMRAPAKAYRSLRALARAFPEDAALAARADADRRAAMARVSLKPKERLYLRRLYCLAAVQYANQNADGAKDLLEEILRQDPGDADSGALDEAMARGTLFEDQLQKEE